MAKARTTESPTPNVMTRRAALGTIGGFGVVALLAACGSDGDSTGDTTGTSGGSSATLGDGTTSSSTADTACTEIPTETAGPFPGDGSNGPNVLAEDGVVRSDIRSSFGASSGTANGIPLTMTLTITDTEGACAPLEGAAVYVWHCDAEGRYSLYSDGVTGENYLRGVQESGADGTVTFTTIFPGCYQGRWPHIHFEVYPDLAASEGGGAIRATSQLAFPEDVCSDAYTDGRYPDSASNLAQLSLSSDMVFADDGATRQLAVVTGDASRGYTATLAVPV
jgi:protocatechuate 3,4-dioxygenase beta subunit